MKYSVMYWPHKPNWFPPVIVRDSVPANFEKIQSSLKNPITNIGSPYAGLDRYANIPLN